MAGLKQSCFFQLALFRTLLNFILFSIHIRTQTSLVGYSEICFSMHVIDSRYRNTGDPGCESDDPDPILNID